jgi:hypothetical protein
MAPTQRLFNAVGAETQVKASLERMTRRIPEPLGKPLGVTMITAGADLRAARNWVPRGIRPFDCCSFCHAAVIEQNENLA